MGLTGAMPWKCPDCRINYAPHVDSCGCQVEKAEKDIARPSYVQSPGIPETAKCFVCGKVHVMGVCKGGVVTS
jgi:hypothetical protein